MNTTEAGPLYDPAAEDYAAGRADQLAGHCDIDRAVRSEEYRKGQQDERTANVDAELLAYAERGGLAVPGPAGDDQE
jgi:hypothetical protein